MKTALNAWSVSSDASFEETFAAVKDAGFDGIELNLDAEGKSAHSLYVGMADSEIERIAELSQKYSLPVISVSSSLGWKHHIGVKADHDVARRNFEAQLIFAAKLGAKGILTLPDGVNENGSYLRAYETSLEFYESERAFINDCNLTVGLENVWNGFFTSAWDMVKFIRDCDNPLIKAYFDAGNVFAFSRPEDWIEILGDRIGFVHVKGFLRNKGLNSGGSFCPILDGGINWQSVMKRLSEAGFDYYVTAEVGKSGKYTQCSYEEFYKGTQNELRTLISYT